MFSEASGLSLECVEGLLERHPAIHIGPHLGITQCLHGRYMGGKTPRPQPVHLLDQAPFYHGLGPGIDPRVEGRSPPPDPEQEGMGEGWRGLGVIRLKLRDGTARQLVDFKGPDEASLILRRNPDGRLGIDDPQALVKVNTSLRLSLAAKTLSDLPIGSGAGEDPAQKGAQVKPAPRRYQGEPSPERKSRR